MFFLNAFKEDFLVESPGLALPDFETVEETMERRAKEKEEKIEVEEKAKEMEIEDHLKEMREEAAKKNEIERIRV